MIKVETVEISKLELQLGDLLVIRVPPDWTMEQQVTAHEAVKTAMRMADVNAPIIIGTTDVEFQVVRKAARDAA